MKRLRDQIRQCGFRDLRADGTLERPDRETADEVDELIRRAHRIVADAAVAHFYEVLDQETWALCDDFAHLVPLGDVMWIDAAAPRYSRSCDFGVQPCPLPPWIGALVEIREPPDAGTLADRLRAEADTVAVQLVRRGQGEKYPGATADLAGALRADADRLAPTICALSADFARVAIVHLFAAGDSGPVRLSELALPLTAEGRVPRSVLGPDGLLWLLGRGAVAGVLPLGDAVRMMNPLLYAWDQAARSDT